MQGRDDAEETGRRAYRKRKVLRDAASIAGKMRVNLAHRDFQGGRF